MGEKVSGNFALNSDFHVNLGIFYMPQIYGMGPTVYFPSEGRRVEDFFALKIRRLRPGLNSRTWDTKGQHATPRPPKPYIYTHTHTHTHTHTQF